MPEIRCKKCNRLLMKGKIAYGELKCPKCGYINGFMKHHFGMLQYDEEKTAMADLPGKDIYEN